jgi:RimJ/RimL family protein N-acetyltransferase
MRWLEAAELVGERVTLAPLALEHAPGLLVAADDDAVFARWHTLGRPRTLAESRRMVQDHLDRAEVVSWVQLVQGRPAGVTTYYDVVPAQRTVAIGSTWLSRSHQRTGVNTEAKLLLLTRAFETLRCVRVVWHTDVLNLQSQEAIEGLGAQREGLLRKHKLRRDGTWRDTVQYAMTDDDWPAARASLRARLHR